MIDGFGGTYTRPHVLLMDKAGNENQRQMEDEYM